MGKKTNAFLTLTSKGFNEDDIGDVKDPKWGSMVFRGSGQAEETNLDPDKSKDVLGSIEVLEYKFSINQVGSEDPGRPRSVESIQRSQFRFKKFVDNRSPILFFYCVTGKWITKAELMVFGTDRVSPYLTYTMSDVHVSSYEPSGGGDLPTEWISLMYGRMCVDVDKVKRAWSWVFESPT
jgi:type VI protein secretion system component Hcp